MGTLEIMFAILLPSIAVLHIASAGSLVFQDSVGEGSVLHNASVRSGCPDISELPIVQEKKFIGFRWYMEKGHDIPALSCNGPLYDGVNEQQVSAPPGQRYPVGSIFVHPGCTFYGFHDKNFEGEVTIYTGPLFKSNVPSNAFGDITCHGMACVPSYLVDCKQKYPDCVPSDSWKTVASFDNSISDLPSTFTYKYIIGTTWSFEMSESMSIDETISFEIKAAFYEIFEESLGTSVTTGYNWSEISSEAKSETQEFSVTTNVPGGRKIEIQQTKGVCGNSEVNTEMFRNVVTFQDGSNFVETINL